MMRTSVSNPPPITICTSFYDSADTPSNAGLALEEDDEQDDDDEKGE
jgi:hypothetical protein